MKNNKKILIIVIFFTIAILLSIIVAIEKNKNIKKDSIATIDKYDIETIEQVKEDTNASADTEMYEIVEEYDGRKIVQIRPNIQFDTVLAGILKNDKPEENEIQNLIQKSPKKSGIWISEKSRNQILKLLEENSIIQFEVDNEGYLKSTEESSKDDYITIQRAIQSDKIYIIDISGKSYIRDDFTGEIVEYPFEEMDPDQILEVYNNENSTIIELTTNSGKNITSHDILTDVLLNLE